MWMPPDSSSGWLRPSANWCSCQRQPGFGGSFPQSFHHENAGQNLEGAPFRWSGKNPTPLWSEAAFTSVLDRTVGSSLPSSVSFSQPTTSNPCEVSERPQDGMVDIVRVQGELYLGHGA